MKKNLYIVHTFWASHATATGDGMIHYAGFDKKEADTLRENLAKQYNGMRNDKGQHFCGAVVHTMKPCKGWK